MSTAYHAKYFAYELTKRCASDSMEKLAASLADAQVDLNPHQVEAALFAFRSPLSKGAILADEVGLGKTIEAGILLSQRWAERKRKILIIVPAALRKQWHQELSDKFFLPSVILETKTFNEQIREGKQGTAFPRLKRFLSEVQQGKRVNTIWLYDEVGSTDEATKELKALFPELQGDFETPKPTRLITQMLQIATASGGNDLVLDFFAGSGTTGESVLKLNAQDGGHRKSLLVQLPQPTGREDLRTIADITRERLRRVAKQMIEEEDAKLPLTDGASSDRGFKAFKLQTSNFKTWNSDLPVETEPEARTAALAKNLEMHVNHLVAGREQDDLLFEILLKSGFPLSVAVERLEIEGKTVFSVAERALLICLDEMVSPEVVKAMAEMKPERVIFLDAGFAGNDQLKTNALQTMKAKGVTSFRTV